MRRRLIYTLLAAAVLLGIAPAQAATDYGSGVLGNWTVSEAIRRFLERYTR